MSRQNVRSATADLGLRETYERVFLELVHRYPYGDTVRRLAEELGMPSAIVAGSVKYLRNVELAESWSTGETIWLATGAGFNAAKVMGVMEADR